MTNFWSAIDNSTNKSLNGRENATRCRGGLVECDATFGMTIRLSELGFHGPLIATWREGGLILTRVGSYRFQGKGDRHQPGGQAGGRAAGGSARPQELPRATSGSSPRITDIACATWIFFPPRSTSSVR